MDATPEDDTPQVPELTNNRPRDRGLFAKNWHCTGFQDKKLWDILQLLMPLIIAIVGTVIFQWAMKERDLKIADDRANQEALIAYFDQTASLLFEHIAVAI